MLWLDDLGVCALLKIGIDTPTQGVVMTAAKEIAKDVLTKQPVWRDKHPFH